MTERQRRFCEEYLKDCNATQAAIRAGYAESTASSVGAKNLRHPQVQEYLSAQQADTREHTGVTREDIVLQLKKIGLSDMEPSDAKVSDKLKAMDMMIKLLGFDKQPSTEDAGGGVVILPEPLASATEREAGGYGTASPKRSGVGLPEVMEDGDNAG